MYASDSAQRAERIIKHTQRICWVKSFDARLGRADTIICLAVIATCMRKEGIPLEVARRMLYIPNGPWDEAVAVADDSLNGHPTMVRFLSDAIMSLMEKPPYIDGFDSSQEKFPIDQAKIDTLFVLAENIFGVPAGSVKGNRQRKEEHFARKAVTYALCSVFNLGPSETGRIIGRNHSSIIKMNQRHHEYYATKELEYIKGYDGFIVMAWALVFGDFTYHNRRIVSAPLGNKSRPVPRIWKTLKYNRKGDVVDGGTVAEQFCDCCGASLLSNEEDCADANEAHPIFESMTLSANWGYYSKHDTERWTANICERCAEDLSKTINFSVTDYFL